MKVLIYGSKGWIGGLFIDFLKKNTDVHFVEGLSRIDNVLCLEEELIDKCPTHVISFIGRTHGVIDDIPIGTIDYLEYPGKLLENVRDNLFSPLVLADTCKKMNIHYTYLGTGCIFNCDTNSENVYSFDENSLPNYFGSSYSIVKGFTDRLMHNYSGSTLNLRIRMPISSQWNDRNFITKITKYQRICSIPNSMTVLDDFFPIFLDLMHRKKTGTWNCTNPGLISHNEVLEIYRALVKPDFTWENFNLTEQAKILKSDRSNNLLDTTLIESEYPNLKNIKESVADVISKFKF
jgi:nucleoside-diphosphate-sugar epimerase